MSEAKSSSSKQGRIFYFDNIRILLTILIVLHHVAVAYGGIGGWPLKEAPSDPVSPIIFGMFNAINQSYVLSLFFLLAGYFMPRSCDKKGPIRFFTDRLIRLGVPLIFFTTLIAGAIDYLVVNFARGGEVSFLTIMTHRIQHPTWRIGPLWFLQGLLVFSAIYVVYRIASKRSFSPFKDGFPTNRVIVGSIIGITLGTFFVRIWYPVGVEVFKFQLAHFVHYGFCFWVGILAYRGRWFESLSRSRTKVWRIVAPVTVIALPFMMGFGGATENLEVFLGGFSWQAFITSAWESIACLSIIISLLYVFQKRYNGQGSLLRWMSPNFYTVYIMHQLVVVAIMVPFLGPTMPTALKFVLVALISVPACFLVSDLIRRIPYARRVLA